MKSFSRLYEVCIHEGNRRFALKNIKKSRRFRETVRRQNMTDSDIVEESFHWIVSYENEKHKPKIIREGTDHKERCIMIPTIRELFVQHCVVNALMPVFCQGMYEHTYASIRREIAAYLQNVLGLELKANW